jgi:DNA-binding LytR/AlgR family response regulator
MIKAIAIDDEQAGLDVIQAWSSHCNDLDIQRYFTSAEKALNYIQEFPVDLLFLDIQMPKITGIQFAEKVPPHICIVFTTAFSDYAVKGFELNAVDYLLKPFSLDRFKSAIDRVKQRMAMQTKTVDESSDSIFIRTDYALLRVRFQNILVIEAYDDYIKIHQSNERPLVARMTMKAIYAKLPGQFTRTHRSWIVNKNFITKQTARTVWIGELEIPVSPERGDVNRGQQLKDEG